MKRPLGGPAYAASFRGSKPEVVAHTPGPWVVAARDKAKIWDPDMIGLRPNGSPFVLETMIAEVYQSSTHAGAEHQLAERAANARLIAAAPELLEECRHALRNVASMYNQLPLKADAVERQSLEAWVERLRQAIEKAEARA